MKLAGYNITFVHKKGSNNILADGISRLKMLDIYKDPIEDPKKIKVSNIEHITEVDASKKHTLNSNVLHAEQKWDTTCKNLTSQSHYCSKNTFNTVIISPNGILQKQQYVLCYMV